MINNNKIIKKERALYLAFYAYSQDTSAWFSCTTKMVDIWSGPFTHVQIIYDSPNKFPNVLCTNLTRNLGTMKKGVYSMDRPGYSFIKITMKEDQFTRFQKCETKLLQSNIHFSNTWMFGLVDNPKPLTTSTKGWYCAAMVQFMLRESGWLTNYTEGPSCTSLYHECIASGASQMNTPPNSTQTCTSCEEVEKKWRST